MLSWFSTGNLINVTSLKWDKGKNIIILMDAEKTFNRIHHLFLIKTNKNLCKLVIEGNLFNWTVYKE